MLEIFEIRPIHCATDFTAFHFFGTNFTDIELFIVRGISLIVYVSFFPINDLGNPTYSQVGFIEPVSE